MWEIDVSPNKIEIFFSFFFQWKVKLIFFVLLSDRKSVLFFPVEIRMGLISYVVED